MSSVKLSQAQIAEIVQAAFLAAEQKTREYIKANGEHYPCGFAWVKIKPARGPFVSYLKSENIGHRDDYNGGWVVYNPSKNYTQCMDAKEAGARAFAEELKKHGVDARVVTRMD